jgi:hypothetical protein
VWTCVGDITEIAGPWVEALGELEEIPRSRKVDVGTYSYSYAELADVLGHSRPVLARHGLAAFQVPQIVDGEIAMTTVVMHTSGTFLQFAPFHLPAGNTAQSTGSAATYARRYSVTSILGLATEDDDGKNAGTRPQPTLSKENVDRFLTAAHDNLLTVEEIGKVVLDATQGRTIDPTKAWVSEVPALREALARHARNPGEASVPPVPEASPDIEDTPDE